jgi:hypothetical protein
MTTIHAGIWDGRGTREKHVLLQHMADHERTIRPQVAEGATVLKGTFSPP